MAGALPGYLPPGAWSQQPGCTYCKIKPDNLSLIFNGHWHDTMHYANNGSSSIQFSFTGVPSSVFYILPPSAVDVVVAYDLTFKLDRQPVGLPFTRTKDQLTNSYQYNVSVISLDNLKNTEHTFIMEMAQSADTSVTLFYCALSLYDDGEITSPKKHANHGAMVGGVLGALATIVGAAGLFFAYVRRRRAKGRDEQVARDIQPFTDSLQVHNTGPQKELSTPRTKSLLRTPLAFNPSSTRAPVIDQDSPPAYLALE
ncbi:hypothetical protein V5O48_009293 [Marasmius crinis-equi]|uniref:Uncharacterized protein n=1 Tax=Marasmius crinis-equi TaxID=585013 RepID=A0ABR3FBG9_9AGAR